MTQCLFAYMTTTYALSFLVEHRPQTTCLHPALSCAAASIFLQLYLYPAVHISFSRSLFQVFLGRRPPLWPCGVHCSACLVMLSSFLLNMTVFKPVPFSSSYLVQHWLLTSFSHNSLLAILSAYVNIHNFAEAHSLGRWSPQSCQR